MTRIGRHALARASRLLSSSGRATAARYAWVEEWEGEGFCVALVEATNARDVLAAMVPEPAIPIGQARDVRAWAREQQLPHYATAVEATELGAWVVSVEGNGFLATLDAVLHRLSEKRKAVVLFRNVNALMRFVYASDSSVIRAFDPLLYDNRGLWIGAPLAQEKGLTFGLGAPMACAFACAERISGVTLTREFLSSRDAWIAAGHHPQ